MSIHSPAACALLLAFTAASVPLPAQTAASEARRTDTGAKAETAIMEAFTVTGTNIRRIDEEKTLPITVIEMDEIVARSTPTAADFFETITSNGGMVLNETNVLGADARGDNVSINLRGVGSGNTLTLINGRRMAPHPISQAE